MVEDSEFMGSGVAFRDDLCSGLRMWSSRGLGFRVEGLEFERFWT